MRTYMITMQRTDGRVATCFVQGEAVVEPNGSLAVYQASPQGRVLVEAWPPGRWLEVKLDDRGKPLEKPQGVDMRV